MIAIASVLVVLVRVLAIPGPLLGPTTSVTEYGNVAGKYVPGTPYQWKDARSLVVILCSKLFHISIDSDVTEIPRGTIENSENLCVRGSLFSGC